MTKPESLNRHQRRRIARAHFIDHRNFNPLIHANAPKGGAVRRMFRTATKGNR